MRTRGNLLEPVAEWPRDGLTQSPATTIGQPCPERARRQQKVSPSRRGVGSRLLPGGFSVPSSSSPPREEARLERHEPRRVHTKLRERQKGARSRLRTTVPGFR